MHRVTEMLYVIQASWSVGLKSAVVAHMISSNFSLGMTFRAHIQNQIIGS